MHPVRDYVCEWEKGSAHGQEPLLWWRELFHHPPGGGNILLGSIKAINIFLCSSVHLILLLVPLCTSCCFYCFHLLTAVSSIIRSPVLFLSCTSASLFQIVRPNQWAEEGTGTLTSSPSFSWQMVSPSYLVTYVTKTFLASLIIY